MIISYRMNTKNSYLKIWRGTDYTKCCISDISEQYYDLWSGKTSSGKVHWKTTENNDNEDELDICCTQFCQVCIGMEKWSQKKNVNPTSKKKLRYSVKPYWNEELTQVWENA